MTDQALHSVIPYVVNFSVVVVLLFILIRKPAKKFLYQRHEHMADQIQSAGKAYEKAAARNHTAKQVLAEFSTEEASLLQQEKLNAQNEKQEILSKATAEASRVTLEANRLAEVESAETATKLQKEFIDLVVSVAETNLTNNLKQNDHEEILRHARTSIEAGV